MEERRFLTTLRCFSESPFERFRFFSSHGNKKGINSAALLFSFLLLKSVGKNALTPAASGRFSRIGAKSSVLHKER